MKVTSTNTAKPTFISWENEIIKTGLFKNPNSRGIFLDKKGIKNDEVSDTKVHGGKYKACYLFSMNSYKYWKNLYPNLNWNWGMFGENITTLNLNEKSIYVGSIYKIGSAIIQITQPREPCYKFGVKFKNQNILQQFVDYGCPGTYARVLKPGLVKKGDSIKLLKKANNSVTIHHFFELIFSKQKNKAHLKRLINNIAIPEDKRNEFYTNLIE